MMNIEKAVTTKEPRFMSRALRATISIRRKLNSNVIRKAVHQYFPHAELSIGTSAALLDFLDEMVSLYFADSLTCGVSISLLFKFFPVF